MNKISSLTQPLLRLFDELHVYYANDIIVLFTESYREKMFKK